MKKIYILFLALLMLLSACAPAVVVVTATPQPSPTEDPTPTREVPTSTPTTIPTVIPTRTPSPTQTVSICNRLSYNINAAETPNVAQLWDHLTRLNPCVLVIMDGIGMAAEAVRRFPNAVVIHRDYSTHESAEYLRVGPVTWVNRWDQQGTAIGNEINKRIVRYSTNEPSLGNPAQYLAAEIELLAEASRRGYRVASGNFAVGTFQPHDVLNGVYDNWLRAIRSGNHYLAVHEYTSSALPFGLGQWPREWLLDPTKVQVQAWPRRAQVPIAMWTIPVTAQGADEEIPFGYEEYLKTIDEFSAQAATQQILPPYWHILRSSWFTIRAQQIGLPAPRIILTEAFWDHLGDIGTPLQELKTRFGLSQYMGDMRGINSYQRVWAWYWPGWTQVDAAYWQLAYMDYIYPDNYIGFAQFTWSRNPMWISFDLSGAQGGWLSVLQSRIENHRRSAFADRYGG